MGLSGKQVFGVLDQFSDIATKRQRAYNQVCVLFIAAVVSSSARESVAAVLPLQISVRIRDGERLMGTALGLRNTCCILLLLRSFLCYPLIAAVYLLR